MLLSANFGTYVKNRPGFAKQFHELSDTAWSRSIDLIKHITKRGGQHDFYTRRSSTVSTPQKRILELNEISALALALDTEKQLSQEAHSLHERYSHANHKSRYDAEVSILNAIFFTTNWCRQIIDTFRNSILFLQIAHYLEEKFIEDQATTIRKISGYTNDLKRLLDESVDSSLSLYLFDEYLQKQ